MVQILQGDCLLMLKTLPNESVHCCVTSPPYWGLRDYKMADQIGLEPTPDSYTAKMVAVFREVHRVLRNDGTLWLNLGDSYTGSANNGGAKGSLRGSQNKTGSSLAVKSGEGLKSKDLIGIPWRIAFALQADGWYLRSDIIWAKPNPMPESVTDRPTKAHEYLFLLSKSERYFYDAEAIKEKAISFGLNGGDYAPPGQSPSSNARKTNKQRGHSRRHAGFNDRWDKMTKEEQSANGRNKRSVWAIATYPYPDAHFATFPPKLIEPCILAGAPTGGTVLDPFAGSGTTLMVAKHLNRKSIGIELNPEYVAMAERRLVQEALPL